MEVSRDVKIKKIKQNLKIEEIDDRIPVESFLNIFINGRFHTILSCLPEDELELVTGYLVSNKIFNSYSDIYIINICRQSIGKMGKAEDNKNFSKRINVKGKTDNKVFSEKKLKTFISTACSDGADNYGNLIIPVLNSEAEVPAKAILGLNKKVLKNQRLKKKSGGLHSAALFDCCGSLMAIREDIGRHNCLDKIFGYMLLNKIKTEDKIIYTSGRISIDAVLKNAAMAIPVLVTNSSVSYNAVETARKINLTLIGYARGGRFNIYSIPERIFI